MLILNAGGLQIRPNKSKSARTNANPPEQMQIRPNKCKSARMAMLTKVLRNYSLAAIY